MVARSITSIRFNGLQKYLRKVQGYKGQSEQLLRARIQEMPDVRAVHKVGRGKVSVLQERAEDKAAWKKED